MPSSVRQGWDPDRLRRHRERHGLTLDQVADAVRNLALDGFTPPNATFQTVGRHERGESYPGPRYQRAYRELFGVSDVELGFRAPLPAEVAATRAGRSGAPGQRPRRPGGLSDPAELAELAGLAELATIDPATDPAGLARLEAAARGRAAFARAVSTQAVSTQVISAQAVSDQTARGGADLTVTARMARPAVLRPAPHGHAPDQERDRPGADDWSDPYGALAAAEAAADVDADAGRPMGAQEAAARALASDRLRAAASRSARTADVPLAEALAVILAAQRDVEDTVGSAPLLGPVTAQLAALMPLVFEARGAARRAMVDVAAQWAQFAGWLYANTGSTAQARVWLDRGAEWAAESGNPSLTANILSYKGHLAWESGAVGPLIGLSQAAQRVAGVYPGQRAYDAGQEARGHAMTGDAEATDRGLARARELWQLARDHPDGPPPWSYYFSPAFAQLQEGLAHRYLARQNARRARRAAEDLSAGLAGLPEPMRRAEWAAEYVYHLAVAHIHTAEPEAACADTLTAAAIAQATGSRRVMGQVRRLHNRVAQQWPTLPAVTELTDRLHDPEPPGHQ
ncbi:helix-turn-helix transcriptional regulator [Frankia sp. CNm7]|uniref:Helix-turn-helix transcriptional regulator n=1 Tax=Frankia nepalensis TaxID=1836974 RepID=A0A937RD63_9ACTN|nr:helix-turn-helix transcriptional regulator [Frankia nepalensis]MBL7502230.1 helix-turn-helix transcriptional regulator [Frankia nepalensis]MBL7513038.1 helix-turn-helix transcriptional regulator [Frankia nepalensis]MBL7523805.1 helix-turn-helix transcriptional regulator [Frankia nepalensis]MBL7628265.1 helix-turn-helix transcriptional regulator [Frankia nepalensis]